MTTVREQVHGIARRFQQSNLGQLVKSISAIQPQDVALLLRSAMSRRSGSIPPINSDFYDILDLLTPEERLMQQQIRAFMEQRIRPVAADYWERAAFPHEIVPAFAALIKDTFGTKPYSLESLSPLMMGIAAMEMARVDASMYTFFGVHWGLAMGAIDMFASDEQKQRWLPAMERFERIGAFALTEPEVGSATAAGLTTTARREGDSWVLNGEKRWIGNATFADLIVVFARNISDHQVNAFVVERGTPGLTTQKMEGKIALRMVQNANIQLNQVRVSEANRLPGVRSFRDVGRHLTKARAIVAWAMTGVSMGAYERALEYTTKRMQFGRPIASFQLVQNALVEMLGNVTAMQTLSLRMSQLHARDGFTRHERASLAKAFCGQKMRETVSLARGILGGNGILLDHEVARYFADAEALYSYEGTHEMNTLIVGRAITGSSAFV